VSLPKHQEPMNTKCPKSKFKVITPAMADRWLSRLNKSVEQGTFRQRRVSQRTVHTYAKDIENGAWMVTHQGIAFDVNGNLLDGQHRLWAIKRAGVPAGMFVTTNLPVDRRNGVVLNTMDAIDCGLKRSVAQALRDLHDIPMGANVASVCRAIAQIATGSRTIKLSMAQILEIDKVYGDNIRAVFSKLNHRQCVSWAAPIAIYHAMRPERALLFAEGLAIGAMLPAGHPALALRNWLSNKTRFQGDEGRLHKIRAAAFCLERFDKNLLVEKALPSGGGLEWLIESEKANLDKVAKHVPTEGE
jgi:hypothetical protein